MVLHSVTHDTTRFNATQPAHPTKPRQVYSLSWLFTQRECIEMHQPADKLLTVNQVSMIVFWKAAA